MFGEDDSFSSEPPGELRGMEIRRRDCSRRDGFKPAAGQICPGEERSLQCDEIHCCRAEVCRWQFLIPAGADVPESFARPAVFAETRPATAGPQACARAGINVRE